MKKIYLALVAMLLLMSMPQAEAARHQIVTRGDTMMVVDDGDTAVIVGMGLGKIKARVERALNDTLLDAGQVSSDTVDGDVEWKVNGQRADVDLQAINETWAWAARDAMRNFFFWISVIVFLGLLFGYLRRRSQNRVIERAIENNYPLPDGLYGHRQTPRTIYVQQPIVTQAPTPTPPPAGEQAPTQGTATPPPLMSPAYLQHGRQVTSDMINLRALYPAFKWIAVGTLSRLQVDCRRTGTGTVLHGDQQFCTGLPHAGHRVHRSGQRRDSLSGTAHAGRTHTVAARTGALARTRTAATPCRAAPRHPAAL